MRVQIVAAVSLMVVLESASVLAQQTVVPRPVQPAGIVKLNDRHLSVLRQLARGGDSQRLASATKELLDDLNAVKFSSECCDYRTHYFLVVFTAPDTTGTTQIVPVLFHNPAPDSPELPGIHGEDDPRLYEVFLSDPDAGVALQATYTVAHEENPAEKQLGDLVGTVIGKLAFPVAAAPQAGKAPVPAGPPRQPADPVMVRFSRLYLPEAGPITSKYVVKYPNVALHLKALAAIVNADQSRSLQLRFAGVEPGPSCKAFSDQIKMTFEKTVSADPCGGWVGDVSACAKKLGEEIGKAASAYLAAAPKCPPDEAVPLVQPFVDASQDVKAVSATSTIANSALVRYGVGFAAGFIARVGLDATHPRAQIQSGKIAANPLTRQLAMGVVNLTPWGYDSHRQTPSLAERARFFIGPVFAPNFGLAGGFAFEINRYLAVNAGYARLWFDTPKDGEKFDQVPSDANKAAPFDLRSTGVWFVGVSYNLK